MSKIETLTPTQWAKIPRIRQWWLANASRQVPKGDSDAAVIALYELNGLPAPEIINCASPLAACVLIAIIKGQRQNSLWASLRDSLGDSLWASLRDSLWASLRDSLWDSLWDSLQNLLGASLRDSLWDSLRASLGASLRDSLWDSLGDSLRASLRDSLNLYSWQYDCAFFDGSVIAGVKVDQQKYDIFKQITGNLSVIFPYADICIVCNNPIYCGWDDAGRIHAENRAAVEYSDGFKVWALEGYRVPEALVMAPEKQTIQEINEEENEEIKRIRIGRYGWSRYLIESNAKIAEFGSCPNKYLESLMHCDGFSLLNVIDPSTGRPYSLEVSPDCKTNRDAQEYLLAPEIALQGLGIECKNVYPSVRT